MILLDVYILPPEKARRTNGLNTVREKRLRLRAPSHAAVAVGIHGITFIILRAQRDALCRA